MPEQSGETPKRFQIKKHFQITSEQNAPQGTPKKRFVITSETPPETPHAWFKQSNEDDCGPCLILNSLPRLDPGYTTSNIAEVRASVNSMRRARGLEELPATANLTSEDLGRYLAQAGRLEVEEFPVLPYEAQEVLQAVDTNLMQRQFDLIYTTVGRHFRGIMPVGQPNRYVLLDSLLDAPQLVGEDEVRLLLTRSAVGAHENRIERIGIVRRSDTPGYTIKS
jgi:hypothetical protein